jgi:hypothetical protein
LIASPSTPRPQLEARTVRIIHPFHPLFGQTFQLVDVHQHWGENRVVFQDPAGKLHSIVTAWTDVLPADPIVIISAGRSPFRLQDLIELAQLVADLKAKVHDEK